MIRTLLSEHWAEDAAEDATPEGVYLSVKSSRR